ncbi:cardiolipin synthase [Halopseudomonas sabulinigri]|uniref:Cardiolipin synthase B n=1 Tax=Halopseudomonas sabulinigri TaxID=472181 RepID=A0A1H1PCR0_9GAMM|nr:cardiolipin synthase ClsB [Halopseudomonas sabulinigri]SDS08805.1 cardiolipin synthase [Halopseudomonas sabulinigri]
MKPVWREGNDVELLINGEAFYPAVFEAIRQARQEVLLETFIIFDDDVGQELKSALIEAANNGAHVEVMVDGYGTAEIGDDYLAELASAGVTVHMFDPRPRILGYRTNLFRRLHRKIVVIDGTEAFVGGINFSCDHLAAFGPKTKQDYAVRVRGPIVADIHETSSKLFEQAPGNEARLKVAPPHQQRRSGTASIQLAVRDNDHHKSDIEKEYLKAIRSASRRIVIANAYFYPGYRLLRELRRAARRGVKVTLILQGEPDMPWVRAAGQLLYGYLIKDGIVIHEYCRRPLHGKVALVDSEWSTVGSSNLDPLSLSLNLEANLNIRDAAFNQQLYKHLEELAAAQCQEITHEKAQRGYWWRAPLSYLGYHFTRHFPSLVGFLPAHTPRLKPALPLEAEREGDLTTLELEQEKAQ